MELTFNNIYHKHHNVISTVISEMIIGTNVNLDETINDVFLHISNALINYNPNYKNSLLNYVLVIAKRKTYDIIRFYDAKKNNRFNYVSIENIDVENIVESTNDIEIDFKTKIDAIFNIITKEEKRLLILHFYDGYSYEEIAKKLKTNVNNIKIKFFRLKKKINLYFN